MCVCACLCVCVFGFMFRVFKETCVGGLGAFYACEFRVRFEEYMNTKVLF